MFTLLLFLDSDEIHVVAETLARIVDRLERRPETMLSDTLGHGAPFVLGVENWANAADVTLDADWRLALSRRMRDHLLARGPNAVPAEIRQRWLSLMKACLSTGGAMSGPDK